MRAPGLVHYLCILLLGIVGSKALTPTYAPSFSPGYCSSFSGSTNPNSTDYCTECADAGCTWCEPSSGQSYCFDSGTSTCSGWLHSPIEYMYSAMNRKYQELRTVDLPLLFVAVIKLSWFYWLFSSPSLYPLEFAAALLLLDSCFLGLFGVFSDVCFRARGLKEGWWTLNMRVKHSRMLYMLRRYKSIIYFFFLIKRAVILLLIIFYRRFLLFLVRHRSTCRGSTTSCWQSTARLAIRCSRKSCNWLCGLRPAPTSITSLV